MTYSVLGDRIGGSDSDAEYEASKDNYRMLVNHRVFHPLAQDQGP